MKNTINRGLELNGLVMKYRETREDVYFNELWKEVESFAFDIAKKYKGMISPEDIREQAMICLFDCCRRHIKEGTNVLTYYGKALRQRYYDFYNNPKVKGKERINTEALSLDVTYDDGNYYITEPYTNDDHFDIEDFYKEYRLAKDEIILIDLLHIGYKRNEIIEKLNLTSNQYRRVLNKIKSKVSQYHDFRTIY